MLLLAHFFTQLSVLQSYKNHSIECIIIRVSDKAANDNLFFVWSITFLWKTDVGISLRLNNLCLVFFLPFRHLLSRAMILRLFWECLSRDWRILDMFLFLFWRFHVDDLLLFTKKKEKKSLIFCVIDRWVFEFWNVHKYAAIMWNNRKVQKRYVIWSLLYDLK